MARLRVHKTKRAARSADGPFLLEAPSRRLATSAAAETAGTAESAANLRACNWAAIRGNGSAIVAVAGMGESVWTIPSAAIPSAVIRASIETRPIVAVIPGAGPDKNATDEPLRTVVALRCASVRIIGIVAVSAHRRRTDISGSDANSNPNCNPGVSGNRR